MLVAALSVAAVHVHSQPMQQHDEDHGVVHHKVRAAQHEAYEAAEVGKTLERQRRHNRGMEAAEALVVADKDNVL